jgi:hypothetical protein
MFASKDFGGGHVMCPRLRQDGFIEIEPGLGNP